MDQDCTCDVVHFRDLFQDGKPGKGYELQSLLEDGYEWDTDTSLKFTCPSCRELAEQEAKR